MAEHLATTSMIRLAGIGNSQQRSLSKAVSTEKSRRPRWHGRSTRAWSCRSRRDGNLGTCLDESVSSLSGGGLATDEMEHSAETYGPVVNKDMIQDHRPGGRGNVRVVGPATASGVCL